MADEDFERLSTSNDFFHIERSKEGNIILNAPGNGLTASASSEVTYQLRHWQKTYGLGRAIGCNCGFFLPDGSSYSPYAAYVTAEQLRGFASKQFARFPRLCPAFVIELVSVSDRRAAAVEAKMEDWIANGALVAWLVDPYQKSVTIYEPAKQPRIVTTEIVSGTGPVLGFEFNTTDVWSCYEI